MILSVVFIFSFKMSFAGYKEKVENGDTLVVFLGFDNLLTFQVDRSKTHQTKYGALHHKDVIGLRYGSKVQCSRGWVYILHPTPELWTVTLPHRTQIIYSTDIAMVTFQLDLKPGSIVVEAGTGSGSLSHAILRTIFPTGHLHTFDFHKQRANKAREEFKEHGLEANVTVKHRDVCSTGFDLTGIADAVFLDLPSPWEALPFAKTALKKSGGRVCSFSPCIEQVQRTSDSLNHLGFTEIKTFECLSRNFDVRTINMTMPDLGYPTSQDDQKESVNVSVSYHHPEVGHLEAAAVCDDVCEEEDADDGEEEGKSVKKAKHSKYQKKETQKALPGSNSNQPTFVFKSGLAPLQMPGHTGYLTFATLFPQL